MVLTPVTGPGRTATTRHLNLKYTMKVGEGAGRSARRAEAASAAVRAAVGTPGVVARWLPLARLMMRRRHGGDCDDAHAPDTRTPAACVATCARRPEMVVTLCDWLPQQNCRLARAAPSAATRTLPGTPPMPVTGLCPRGARPAPRSPQPACRCLRRRQRLRSPSNPQHIPELIFNTHCLAVCAALCNLQVGRAVPGKAKEAPDNAIFDSKVLSRSHAEIWADKNTVYIKDTKSSNGMSAALFHQAPPSPNPSAPPTDRHICQRHASEPERRRVRSSLPQDRRSPQTRFVSLS